LFESEFLTSSSGGKRAFQASISAAARMIRTSLPARPYSGKSPAELSALFKSNPLPGSSLGLNKISEGLRTIIRHSVNVNHPHAIAHLHCPPTIPAVAADFLISALNQSMDSFDQAPVATIVEQELIQFLCREAGLPSGADGTMTTGGSQSNYLGLLLARDSLLRKHWKCNPQKSGLPAQARRFRILCSAVSHFTVEKSASQLGLGTDSVIRIPVDSQFRMDVAFLRRALERLEKKGLVPMAIVATAGSTDFGSIDPLPEIAEVASDASVWLHVDAAYGGALLFSGHHRGKLASIETADSLAIDFHKLLWQPIPCSAFLLRHQPDFDCIKMHADYLNPESLEAQGVPNLVTTSLLTSRRFDALKLWISFQYLGRKKLAAMIDRTIDLARYAAAMVKDNSHFELICEPQLSTVVFRYVPSSPDVDSDKINSLIRQRLFDGGKAVIGHTRVRGMQCLKFTCMNPATTKTDLQKLLGLIETQGLKLERET
jgi:L-2,4-diaminobutyrate decarboxylase